MTRLDILIERILVREGGVADVGDGKGVTRYGQTPDWLAQFNLPVPKTRTDAAANYAKWIAMTGLDVVLTDADDLADIVLDIAVMSSAGKAVKALQAALKIHVDGVLGTMTLAALGMADRKQLAREVIAWDISYQGRLVTLDPSRAKYAAGWANRIAEHVRRLS